MNAEMLKLQLKLQEKGVDVAKLQTARKTEKVSKIKYDYQRSGVQYRVIRLKDKVFHKIVYLKDTYKTTITRPQNIKCKSSRMIQPS